MAQGGPKAELCCTDSPGTAQAMPHCTAAAPAQFLQPHTVRNSLHVLNANPLKGFQDAK